LVRFGLFSNNSICSKVLYTHFSEKKRLLNRKKKGMNKEKTELNGINIEIISSVINLFFKGQMEYAIISFSVGEKTFSWLFHVSLFIF